MNTAGDSAGQAPAPATRSPRVSTCPRCGTSFECGAQAGHCWCATLPALPVLASSAPAQCLCERCLREELARC